uniref:Ig-like domain-containing protein n=1 Tax=Serinus canaria TaxID=9135 RepID=A0A8C9MDQ3_SERCA
MTTMCTHPFKVPSPVDTLKGSDVILQCEIAGTPPFEVAWFKDRRQVRSSKKFKVTAKHSIASLHILNLESQDTGEYQCKAMNEVGSDTCTYPSLPISEPAVILEKTEPITVMAGNPFTLECKVGGTPELITKWYKDGRELKSDRKYQISFFNNISTLKLNALDVTDTGSYTCVAANVAGSDECSAFLTVQGQ